MKAVDEDNQTSVYQYQHEFNHTSQGKIRQMQIHVQRWRDEKMYEEFIY